MEKNGETHLIQEAHNLNELKPLYTDSNEFERLSIEEREPSSKSSETSNEDCKERETWGRSLEFCLSLLGYAVGLGNLWRFPYLCMRNGGGAFLFPFLICLLLCGLPLFFLEVSLGQFLGRSSLHAWMVFPLVKGLGIGMIIINVVFVLYYNMIMAWTLYYLANSFRQDLAWNTCDGWWNTEECIIRGETNYNASIGNTTVVLGANLTSVNKSQLAEVILQGNTSAEEEFWQHNVLQVSSGLGDFGTIPWHLPVCLFVAWILVFLCIMKGVKSIGKVIYVTALMPYVLLTILLIKGLTLEGSVDGIVYYLKPDIKKMMSMQVWVEAALQVFFSLGPGWGPIISMASYNNFNNNCLRDSLIISFIGEGTSVFSGFVVFTILGYIANDLGVPIAEVVKSGPGLAFVAYPQALSRLPVSQLWAVLFFFMLLLVGMDSQFSSVESVIAGITDLFPRLRRRRTAITMLACVIGFIIGLPFCLQGGMYLFQLVDWYVAIFAVPVFGFTECVTLSWIYGAEKFSRDVELMLGRGVPMFMRVCWMFITPGSLLGCLVFTLYTYTPPNYGEYTYPVAGRMFGWFIASAPLLPLPIAAIHELWTSKETSFTKKIVKSSQPTQDWKPHSAELQKTYKFNRFSYSSLTFRQRLTVNLFGKEI